MNLSQIEVIVEIARSGSISKAAQNLYISQPGVSKILQRFEEEAGSKIFERISTGIRLTPLGRKFVNSANDIIEQAEKLESIFRDNVVSVFMELNLASMSYRFMKYMISELYNKYSENPIHIKYVECGFTDQLELISKGDIEIGFVSFWQNDLRKAKKKAAAKGIEYHHLGACVPYIAVSRTSRIYPPEVKGLDFKRLSRMPIVSISPSSPSSGTGWDFIRRIFSWDKLEASGREITTYNTEAMNELVQAVDGFNLILLNKGIHEKYGFYEGLRLIPIEEENMQFEMGWLQKANTVRSPLANEFITLLNEYSSDD